MVCCFGEPQSNSWKLMRWRLRYSFVLKGLLHSGQATVWGLCMRRRCWRRFDRLLYMRKQMGHGLGSRECSLRWSAAATHNKQLSEASFPSKPHPRTLAIREKRLTLGARILRCRDIRQKIVGS